METIENLSRQVNELTARLRSQSHELEALRRIVGQQADISDGQSQKGIRIDNDGWMWIFDPQRNLYIKTSKRVNKPVAPCRLIHGRNIMPGTITEDKLEKGLLSAIADKVKVLLSDFLRDITSKLNDILQSLSRHNTRIEVTEQAIEELRSNPSCDCPHIIQLTQAEYDALTTYERGAIYFIIEPEYWHFGDTFPVILGGYGESLGEPLPILLN